MMDLKKTHFALFDLPQSFALDAAQLDSQFRRLQNEVHPDRFAAASESERRLSLQMATQVNEAYQTLKNPLSRARYLLQLKGIDTLEESNTAMPVDFLMQQMDWREALEDAKTAGDTDALDALLLELRAAAKALYAGLGVAIDQQTDDALATEAVRKLRFIDKVRSEIEHALESLE